MLIPYYRREGFVIDFTCAIPIYDENLKIYNIAMYIHPKIALLFRDIWSPQGQYLFDVGYYVESNEDFDCKDFAGRVESFKPFREARVKRRLEDKRSSIFFDSDEVQILAGMFKQERFTAIVEVYIEGKVVPIEKVPANMYRIIKPFLDMYHVIEVITPSQYRRYKNSVKVRVVKNRRTGVRQLDKQKGILRTASGVVVAGAGLAALLFGARLINEGISDIKGEIVDAEIVKR